MFVISSICCGEAMIVCCSGLGGANGGAGCLKGAQDEHELGVGRNLALGIKIPSVPSEPMKELQTKVLYSKPHNGSLDQCPAFVRGAAPKARYPIEYSAVARKP